MCEPEETMKIFRNVDQRIETVQDSVADQMLVNGESSVREGQTNSVNFVGLQYCQHPSPVECLSNKQILLRTLFFVNVSVSVFFSCAIACQRM